MRGYLRTAIGLAVALMAFFLRSADLASVWLHIRRARLDLIIAAFGGVIVSYVVRVRQWQRLLALAELFSQPRSAGARLLGRRLSW